MSFYLLVTLGNLSLPSFLETRASGLLDLVVIFLAMLPLLSMVSIFFAIKEKLKLHQFSQFVLFLLSLAGVALFAYTVHYEEGLEALLVQSSIEHSVAMMLLSIHILITIATLTLWMFALIYALSDRRRMGLPGVYSVSHAKAGRRVFMGIVLMALSSSGIYWMLFMA